MSAFAAVDVIVATTSPPDCCIEMTTTASAVFVPHSTTAAASATPAVPRIKPRITFTSSLPQLGCSIVTSFAATYGFASAARLQPGVTARCLVGSPRQRLGP